MYITEENMSRVGDCGMVEIKLEAGSTPWEGGINGRFYRISRGIPVKVPRELAMLISQGEQIMRLSDETVAPYKKGAGKCLGGDRK